MMYKHPCFLAACSLSTVVALASPNRHGGHSIHRRAASDTSTSYLPDLVDLISVACGTSCTNFTSDITACVAGNATNQVIAACSCSKHTLVDIQTCATCIVADPTSNLSIAALLLYNGFAQQCVSVGLANVTSLLPGNSTLSNSTIPLNSTFPLDLNNSTLSLNTTLLLNSTTSLNSTSLLNFTAPPNSSVTPFSALVTGLIVPTSTISSSSFTATPVAVKTAGANQTGRNGIVAGGFFVGLLSIAVLI